MKEVSRTLLKCFCLFAFMALVSAVLLPGSGTAAVKAKAPATDLTKTVPDTPAIAKSPAAAAAVAKPAPDTRININTADKAKLEKIPEIGPVKAQAIIDGRPFKAVEDVMRVKGIKGKVFEVIKDYITVK